MRTMGGRTVVDPTNLGIGRDPSALQRISRRTVLHIVMEAGFYLEASHPPHVRDMSVETIAEQIARDFCEFRRTSLKCALASSAKLASARTSLQRRRRFFGRGRRVEIERRPSFLLHLPGWERHAHRVLDVVESEGADLRHVVLCHMNPSLHDHKYQRSLADRGAFIEYDMIGMDLLLRRPAGAVAVRRGERESPSAGWSTTAISTRSSCRRTCS